MLKITPFIWFDDQAEEAANFYVGVFPTRRSPASRTPTLAPATAGWR